MGEEVTLRLRYVLEQRNADSTDTRRPFLLASLICMWRLRPWRTAHLVSPVDIDADIQYCTVEWAADSLTAGRLAARLMQLPEL